MSWRYFSWLKLSAEKCVTFSVRTQNVKTLKERKTQGFHCQGDFGSNFSSCLNKLRLLWLK